MAHDLYPGMSAPAGGGAAVTPNDDEDLPTPSRALLIGTTGTLKVTLVNGETIAYPDVHAAGVYHPMKVKRVWKSHTTATQIYILY